ncbi:hypothetical protein [Ponticaulis sp.]|uniref:hypothetical protein n=1 Tax=Ponticaulis sp. TaxID=2020902 RepID=UPI000C433DD4|nr:hypothetical protein [Ponticaulis sp.]MAF56829.1 hypothetical protein [Ponticaulis sp.]MBN03115.1 hypothetical protein [Ponticaulis sp.]|tara:strand:- start:439 stop:639 length:201 start_codon:yes stop_codon:yes gene_type:complete
MTDTIQLAANLLFPENGQQVRDVKFFDVGSSRVTAAQLAEQIVRAEAAIRSGNAKAVEDVEDYLTS